MSDILISNLTIYVIKKCKGPNTHTYYHHKGFTNHFENAELMCDLDKAVRTLFSLPNRTECKIFECKINMTGLNEIKI